MPQGLQILANSSTGHVDVGCYCVEGRAIACGIRCWAQPRRRFHPPANGREGGARGTALPSLMRYAWLVAVALDKGRRLAQSGGARLRDRRSANMRALALRLQAIVGLAGRFPAWARELGACVPMLLMLAVVLAPPLNHDVAAVLEFG